MIQKKPQNNNNKKSNLQTNRRSQERTGPGSAYPNSKTSPLKSLLQGSNASTTNIISNNQMMDPHEYIAQLIVSTQNPRLFFIFDKDNADKMFGYRVRYMGPEDDENEDMCFAYRGVVQRREAGTEGKEEAEEGNVNITDVKKATGSASVMT